MSRILIALLLLFGTLPALAATAACDVIDVFVRTGCPHCADARNFLDELQQHDSSLTIRYHEIGADPVALQRLFTLSRLHGIERPGVPSFLVCGAFYSGFSTAAGSEEWIRRQLRAPSDSIGQFEINTPLGNYSIEQLGLPLFTLVVGLIDGFNPCAMWVLLFLLSILVNIQKRSRILLVAGTFVLVSGMIYFAFMAAWLNLFLLIGYVRWLQISIALLALLIGVIHIKDFFTFGKGISLSISDSVKPTLYARVRNVLHARNLTAALLGVILVAVMVNLIELLCTAGLPALYTQLLTLKAMPPAQYYAYLGLYNLAYIFDDALMVGIAVFTLNKFKLQQRQGRWLKLVSGLVISLLGLLLLAFPEMLI